MGIRQLTHWNDGQFRKVSRPVEKYDHRLWTLLDDMFDTLEHVGGYGCAAVHIGILRRVVVVKDHSGVIEFVNPVITETSSKTQRVPEGSIAPGAPRGYVKRPKKVTVSAFDRNGKPVTVTAEGFLAATFCHEIDHLDGVLYTDKADEVITGPKRAQ